MGLAVEILGLVIFLGAHVFVSMRGRRDALVSRIGRGPYFGLFSLVSVVGLVLIGYGFARYRAEGIIPLWNPPAWTRRHRGRADVACKIAVVAVTFRAISAGAQAPMLALGQVLGLRAPLREWRSRRHRPVGAVLAWAVYDGISLKRRRDAGALRFRSVAGARFHRDRRRHGPLSCPWLCVPPAVISLPRLGRGAGTLRQCGERGHRGLTAPEIALGKAPNRSFA